MSSEGKTAEFDFVSQKKNGGEEMDEDIFTSAVHSPNTDREPQHEGSHEIDLDDDINADEDHDLFRSTMENNSFLPIQSNSKPSPTAEQPVEPETNGAAATLAFPQSSSEQAISRTGTKPADVKVEKKTEENPDHIEITVTEPQKQGDGMSGFMVYRVTTRTNIALFRRKEFAVWRRFSDFLGLHQKLAEKYARKGQIVPPAPEKNAIGSTKIKITAQDNTPNNHSEFVEKRRASLERFMNRTAAHSTLRVDPDFRDFLEIDSDLPKSTNTSAFSGAGVVRLFSRFGETVNKISYKMDESDPWFEEKVQNIEALETQLRKVHGSIELLVLNRKELAQATGTFAKSAAILSNQEEHTALARALAQLAEVEEKAEQVHNDQSNSDFYLFSELLKDYIALIGSVKDVFHERVKAFQTWQHAQQTLNKKRETKARLELQVRNDKVGLAREEVVEWESKVERSHEDFISISNVIKKELEQFELARVKEFKKSIVKYLEALLGEQQDLVKYWEAFLPEAQAIS